jgi:uncharacterized protein (TIGR00251 family)
VVLTDERDDPVAEAVVPAGDGVIIQIEVTPGAKKDAVKGFNSWRKRIEVSVTAKPQKGAANKKVIELLAGVLGVSRSQLEISSGHTSSRKNVKVSEISYTKAVKALSEAFDRK